MAPPRTCECMKKQCKTCYTREYRREKYRLTAYGQWGPRRIDMARARHHLLNLRAQGASIPMIVRDSGVSRSVVQRIITGSGSISPETERKILACTTSRSHRIPAHGASRRLQALAALGWTFGALGERCDMFGDNLARIARGNKSHIYRTTYEVVAALYAELQATPGPSARARLVAVRKGWAPPAAWDDIDNPNERPKGVLTTAQIGA